MLLTESLGHKNEEGILDAMSTKERFKSSQNDIICYAERIQKKTDLCGITIVS